MELVVVKTDVKTPEDVWAGDKLLLDGVLYLGLGGALPTNNEAKEIILKKQNRWLNPPEPFELNTKSLDGILDKLIPELELIWGARLSMPDVEILSPTSFLPRIQELDEITNAKFGYGTVLKSPPTMINVVDHKKLLIPEKYLIRIPRGRNLELSSADFDVKELDWDKPFLENVLVGNLSYALFRQLRGEWGERFINIMKKLEPIYEQGINDLNQAIGQYVKDQLARDKNEAWRLYAVGEKLGVVWQSREGMKNYVIIDALFKTKSLSQIAMADNLSRLTNGQGVAAEFYKGHLNYNAKRKKFEAEKQ